MDPSRGELKHLRNFPGVFSGLIGAHACTKAFFRGASQQDVCQMLRGESIDQPLVIRKCNGGNPRENSLISMNVPPFVEHKGNILQLMSCMEKSTPMGSIYDIFTYIYHNLSIIFSQM